VRVYGTIIPASAPNDPVFWPLHSNADRIWAQWQRHHPNAYRPVSGGPALQNLGDTMQIISHYVTTKTIASVQNIKNLGYRYV
jgi:tyrosinase